MKFHVFHQFLYLDIISIHNALIRAAVCDCGTPWTFLLPFFSKQCYECVSANSYSNILKILPLKNENFQIKTDIFHISAQNIDCGYSLEPHRRGDSNEYPQSIFLSRNKKYNVYSCKPQFYSIKVGFKGVNII